MEKIKPRKTIRNNREKSSLNEFLKIQIFAVICYISVFLISTFIALIIDLSSEYDYIFSIVTFAVSSFAVGFFAGIKIRKNGLVIGILYALPMNVIIALISLILNNFSLGINMIITLIILSIAAGIGGILAVNKRLKR